MFFAHWVHDLSPFVYQFTDTIGIRYYSLAYLLGFVGGALLLHAYARAGRSRLASEQISDFIIAIERTDFIAIDRTDFIAIARTDFIAIYFSHGCNRITDHSCTIPAPKQRTVG